MNGDCMSTRVKICGLTRQADARLAESRGASFLGVILAGGPRLISPDSAVEVLGRKRAGIRRVAVFGNQSVEEIIEIADRLDLDVIQLHGIPRVAVPFGTNDGAFHIRDEPQLTAGVVARVRDLSGREVWPVLRVPVTMDGDAAHAEIPEVARELAAAAGALVLDSHVVGMLGGTGQALDWRSLATEVAELRADVPGFKLVLAGGLKPTNVSTAIGFLHPDVVDVSSGVEVAPGVKDPERIQQFVEAARGAAERSE